MRTFRSTLPFLAAALVACGAPEAPEAPEPQRPASNDAMAAKLAEIAGDIREETVFYRNDLYVKLLESKPQRFGAAMIEDAKDLAVQLLRAGDTERAIEQIDRVEALLESAGSMTERNEATLARLRAISWLRLGEQENCILNHSVESCLLPIRGSGVHTAQRGSRKAIELYAELIERYPDDIGYPWLLNLAYQTLGEYPDNVPPQHLIPPAAYAGDGNLPRMRDVAPSAGILERSLSGGVALDDFTGDGLLDLVTTSWGVTDPMHFWVNRGDGTFEERSEEAYLEGLNGGLNVTHADYDNDGDVDLFVLRGAWLASYGEYPNSLLENLGDGRFRDVTLEAGILSMQPTPSAAWGDYDNDGDLDVFVANETRSLPRPCELWSNDGDGTFTDVAPEVGLDHTGFVKGAVWGDYDNDGDLDLFLSRMGETNKLFRNDDGTFHDVTADAGVAEPVKSFPTWFFDYDNDGWLDLFVATFADFTGSTLDQFVNDYLGRDVSVERSKLFRNNGDGTFEDVSERMNVDRVLLAMGSNFGDVDNDGWLDMYFGNGEPALDTLVPNVLLRNDEGKRFQDATTSAGVGSLQKGHGIGFGDLDNDGDQDLFAVMGGAYSGDVYQNILFENPSKTSWITIRPIGQQSNRSGVGARIQVTAKREDGNTREIHRVVTTGGSFGSSSLQQEIGLGDATEIVEVKIHWPASGTTDVVTNVPLNKVITITEGSSAFEIVDVPTFQFRASAPDHQGHGAGTD